MVRFQREVLVPFHFCSLHVGAAVPVPTVTFSLTRRARSDGDDGKYGTRAPSGGILCRLSDAPIGLSTTSTQARRSFASLCPLRRRLDPATVSAVRPNATQKSSRPAHMYRIRMFAYRDLRVYAATDDHIAQAGASLDSMWCA